MIKASVNFMRPERPVKTSEFHSGYNQNEELTPRRNAKNNVLIAGEYIGVKPMCDGDDLCGCRAEYVITVRQNHLLAFRGQDTDIENQFRNFILLCEDCLDLFIECDTHIGKIVALKCKSKII